ncbi:MAG TPA: VWA-like domain-containing protein [Geobacteraceae bacterium]
MEGFVVNRILENAVVRLLKRRPFYGHLVLAFHREEGGGNHPLGVTIRNGVPLLAVNGARFAGCLPAEQEALLEHAVKHLLHLHMARCRGRNRHDWDIACDLAINPGIAGLPPESAFPARYKLPEGLAAEEYYRLATAPFDTGNLEGGGIGNASRDAGGHAGAGDGAERHARGAIDDHAAWEEADSTPLRLAEEVVRGLVRDARRKCDGEVPVEIRPLVEGLLAPPAIPWRQVLRQFVATAGRVGRKSSWLREHRRFGHDTPGTRKRHRLNLLVGVDVSDSTDTVELREAFARELLNIARGRDALITVLYANSRIQRIESFRGCRAAAGSYHGGGFTDLRPVFDHARTMQPLPAAVIYLTDGIGPAPERMEFPTLWVLTEEGERPAPWGVELRLEV